MFRAYEPDRDKLVAVKVFRLDLPPERVHRLVDELRRLIDAKLTHPGIAAPLAAGISGVSAYLAQEFVAADSLDIVLREHGAAAAADAIRVAGQLAGALDFAAAVDVVHGALHPRDVLLSPDDARLTGLGVARALERVGVATSVRRPYSAPERAGSGAWDRRADIFSLAALMHEMLWAKRLTATGEQAADALSGLPGANLPALRQLFARALADRPGDRFETALAFADALTQAFPGRQVASSSRASGRRRTPADPRRTAETLRTTAQEPRLPLGASHASGSGDADDTVSTAPHQSADDDDTVPTTSPASVDDDTVPTPAPALVDDDDTVPTTTSALVDADSTVPTRPPLGADGDATVAAGHEPIPASRGASQDVSAPAAATTNAAAPGALTGTERRVSDLLLREALRVGQEESPPGAVVPAARPTASSTADTVAADRRRSAAPMLVLAIVCLAVGFAAGYRVASLQRVNTPPMEQPAAQTPAAATNGTTNESTERGVGATTSAAPPPAASVGTPEGTPEGGAAAAAPVADAAGAKPGGIGPGERKEPPPSAPQVGRLLVRSTPGGARVFVDGRDVGRTPVTLRELARGTYAVRVSRDGYQPQERRVSITAARPSRSITIALTRERAAPPAAPAGTERSRAPLLVESRPPGARVFLDGKLVGTTPLSLADVRAGEHAVRLELEGYKPWTFAARIVAGEPNRVAASLER